MPTITVIMGVYNCKDYNGLKTSVMSIINQTYKDWELLICNDGSTDDTLEKLCKIAKLDNRIKILTYSNNRTLAGALNYCLKYAKGTYIARQDDDYDISEKDRFRKQLDFLEKNQEYAFVGSNMKVFDRYGFEGNVILPELVTKEDFLWNSPVSHASIIARKEAYDLAGGYRIATETRRCEDYDLFMRMYALGLKGYNIQENLYEYKVEITAGKKYRPMKFRIDEAIVRYKGFKEMGILFKGIPYIFKPIVIGLIPASLFACIKKRMYKNF